MFLSSRLMSNPTQLIDIHEKNTSHGEITNFAAMFDGFTKLNTSTAMASTLAAPRFVDFGS